jgi:hypothetical protein
MRLGPVVFSQATNSNHAAVAVVRIMPVDNEQWTELTGFDRCAPSPLAFRALVALLDTWSGDDQAAAINHADALLTSWPDAVRLAPWSWCKAAAKGAVPPTWRLVRALQLTTDHLTKGTVNLAHLAQHATLDHITELEIPAYSGFQELSFLYHRPDAFPALKKLRANDKQNDGEIRALAGSPLWRTLESFETGTRADAVWIVHRQDASRIVPQVERPGRVRHLALRSPDLIAAWDRTRLPHLRSAAIIVRSIDEALALAARVELSRLTSLSLAFRCGFSGSSPSDPFLGNVIEADEAAAEAFFSNARLDRLKELAIAGYEMGYWGREGLGRLGLNALIASGLLQRLKRLSLKLLPLGDAGVAALAPALGMRLETLELVDVYCKGDGAAALSDSPCMPSLRHLDLSANRIAAARFVQMASVAMPRLQSLDLSGPRINPYYWNVGQQPLLDAGAAAWAASASVRRLKRLRLQNCHLTDEALTSIFRSPQLRRLEELDLSHSAFTAAAIAQAVVGSPLWRNLKELSLNHCRLDNAAIEALSHVGHAPRLRSLRLGYNSIGPSGAAALARWPLLARVWHLDLHDNLIGDQGLIALARSPHLGRLLELDLEQDCWNSRKFTFSDEAARALATSPSLTRLDALYSGCVDEYHEGAYSPGFSKNALNVLRKAKVMRQAFQAACSDFSRVSEYVELAAFDEEAKLDEHDFRGHPYTLNEQEADPGARRMQQVPLPSAAVTASDDATPPAIRPLPPAADVKGEDIIEGLEFRDPTPATSVSLELDLSLVDRQRPLPVQASKVLSDTLRRLFEAGAIGSFESTGSSAKEGKDGEMIYTRDRFSIGIKGDPEPAVQLIREALWWLGAPARTDLERFPLELTREPATIAGRFLQLAAAKVARWQNGDHRGHRIDRVPFTPTQRRTIRRILTETRAAEAASGWASVATGDGGRVAFYIKHLDGAPKFDTLNALVDVLSLETSGLIHKLMQECDLMSWPMAFAPSAAVARAIDCDWPKVEVVTSAVSLHQFLARGPYHWWSRAAKKRS